MRSRLGDVELNIETIYSCSSQSAGGFAAPVQLSSTLSEFLGEVVLPRTEVHFVISDADKSFSMWTLSVSIGAGD